MRRSEVLRIRELIELSIQSLSDDQALEVVTLHPQWEAGVIYTVGHRVRYNGLLYVTLQEHTSQEEWTPVDAPSLWAKVLIPDETVIPAWEQPDSTNGYAKGDRVLHNKKVWESLIDNNVWEPGVTGTESAWVEVSEDVA